MKSSQHLHTPVLILGGGLAGTSAAYHLKNKPYLLIERENELGGTARSFKVQNFTFDFTGHLLHLHTDYTKKLITKLLKGNFYACTRKAFIYSHKTYTKYPFQANTHGLPPDVIDECLLGFLRTYLKNKNRKINFQKLNFHDWCQEIFGSGISKHFMIPYNEKLYQTSAKNLTVDWCGSFVPIVKPEEVIKGALQIQQKGFGYNTQFLYPKKGGIQVLAQSLGKNLDSVHFGTEIKSIDWKNKSVILSTGINVSYKNLINTIPLLEFLNLMVSIPKEIDLAKKKLKHAGILCLNVGVKRSKISDKSWIYFPENKYPFYRVGFPMNFTPHVVPKGCSSMYVEVPFDRIRNLSKEKIIETVRQGLIDCEILKPSDKLPVFQFLPIRYAYVIYDKHRSKSLSKIFSFLSKNKIQSIGRYGAWKYSFMEEAILDGKKAAEAILN
ncbi:MAG: protoporphyrinogen/coproporphyrinogen oxidase [Bacteriovoracales bacterium]